MMYTYCEFDGTKDQGDVKAGVVKLVEFESAEKFEKWIEENFPFRDKFVDGDNIVFKVSKTKENWIYDKDVVGY